MAKDLRIVFMGTPEFAVAVLKRLLDEGKNIVGVVTAPDKPAGRGRKLHESAVKRFAVQHNLRVLQPKNLKSPDFLNELKALHANLQIAVAFRMLPKEVWMMPAEGTFNLHASLLPDYRGAAPINWAIINGEEKTGVTTFFLDDKIDTGAIILQREVEIGEDESAGILHDRLMETGADLVSETVELIEKGTAKAIPQGKGSSKTAPKLHKENTRIDWNKSGMQIFNLIRGLSPYPAAWTRLHDNGKETELKIYASVFEETTHQMKPGTIITGKKELKVAVKDGFILISELKASGKRKMDVVSFLNGFRLSAQAIMQ